ncbi:MAG TPA: hypothetical protein VKP59_03135, partial [Candidatus Thermoplasmatota archaeon]|nr:hypothetical protein [Candidatus Thermoplasmatota archaeon]
EEINATLQYEPVISFKIFMQSATPAYWKNFSRFLPFVHVALSDTTSCLPFFYPLSSQPS